jgi:hypothetical protein
MGRSTYTHDQLLALRESPLVKKPDGLPSISQWMDVPADQNNNNANNNGTVRRTRGVREGEGGPANEQRPLINPMGQFGRRQSMRKSEAHGMVAAINALFVEPGEETVLGPPKLSFLSASRNAVKAPGETKERTGIVSIDGDNLGDRFPREKNERWTRDRDTERNRDKGYTNGRRGTREDGEGWTNVKGRKSIGQEDFERFAGRNGDRNREKQEGDPENEAARRGNRDRAEPRWGRREETKDEVTKPGLAGGWRERDRDRERERERDWTRGGNGNRAEEDPEWMDTKVEKKEFKPRTQEDFQRWKEQMKAKDTPADERDEPREISTAISATVPPMLTQPLHTPAGIESTQGILFGNWGRDKAVDINAAETISAKPKPDKKSRFMTMFAKPDEAAAPAQSPAPTPASPPPVMEGNADKEGFQRILQMLGQVNVGGAPVAQASPPAPTNGMRQGGGVSLDFHHQTPPPEPQNTRPPRTMEQQSILENILSQRPSAPETRAPQQFRFSSMSPDNALHEQFRHPREAPVLEEHFHQQPQQPPSRNANGPDANLAALLSGRAREESQRDQATKQRERDFLLTLMQQPSMRATPPQMSNPNLPRQNPENHLPAFFDQPRQQPQAQPKGRPGPPPGFMEDPRMFAENEIMRLNAERREQELRQQLSMQQQQQDAMRAKNARLPMGFPGHDEAILGVQRRNTGSDSRPMTNMGIPSQPVPDMAFMGGRGQPGMPPTPQERTNIAPPPGFGGGPMRQPPGLNGPNPQQQMGLGGPSFSAGNTPLGHPPGFAPPGNMRGMGFPVGPGGNGMQGPPQGYFPPPGYGPPMPGMRGEDPRLMFDGHQAFGGPGPRQQQGRPGPPGMY